jgi:hypothetical protein
MKDPRVVLNEKSDELKRLYTEVNALRQAVPLLLEDGDAPLPPKDPSAVAPGLDRWP